MRTRCDEDHIFPEDDPRVQAAWKAMRYWVVPGANWRDAAEVVNAVLKADDETVAEDG